jgi:hypothetical protein
MGPELTTFVEVARDSDFSIQNLPYGIFRPTPEQNPRPGVAFGNYVLDLSAISRAGLFNGPLLSMSDPGSGTDVFAQVLTSSLPDRCQGTLFPTRRKLQL